MYVWQPNQCSWRWGPSPQHRPHCIVLLLQVKASCSRCPTQQFHSGTTLPSVYLDFVPSFCLVPVTLQFSLKYSQCQYRSMSVSLLEYTSRLDENLRSCSRLNFSISRMIHTVHGIFVKMSESWNGWNSQASRSSSLTNSLFSTHSSQNQSWLTWFYFDLHGNGLRDRRKNSIPGINNQPLKLTQRLKSSSRDSPLRLDLTTVPSWSPLQIDGHWDSLASRGYFRPMISDQ